jgi:hypothetical protein
MFSIKRGDSLPIMPATLQDEKKVPIDLTNAVSVTMRWRLKELVNAKKYAGVCVIADAPLGKVEYRWALGDTKFAGIYIAEFHIVFDDGSTLTVPNKGYSEFLIEATV